MTTASSVLARTLLLFCGLVCTATPTIVEADNHWPSGDGLGRLFFTESQRLQLDQTRWKESQRDQTVVSEQPREPAAPQQITLSGVIQPAGKPALLWVNGNMQPLDQPLPSAPSEPIPVPVPGANQTIGLKVGQTWNSSTRTVQERFPVSQDTLPPASEPPPESTTR